jgi:hypothetical protein
VIAAGFGTAGRRRGRRGAYEAPLPAAAAATERTPFEVSEEALDVPSFLRDE